MSGYDPNQSMLPASGGGNIVAMSGGGLVFANGGGPTITERRDAFGRKITSDLQGRARRTQQFASVVSKIGKRGLVSTSKGNGTKRAPPTRITRSTLPLSITKSTTPVASASTEPAKSSPLPASNPIATAPVSQAAQASTSTTPAATLAPLTTKSNTTALAVSNPTAITALVSKPVSEPPSSTALTASNPTTAITAPPSELPLVPQTNPINDILTTLIGSPSKAKEIYTPEEQDAILKTLAPLLLTSDAEKKFVIKMNKFVPPE